MRDRRAHGRALVRPARSSCSTTSCSGRQPLVLYASHLDFEQTNVIAGRARRRHRRRHRVAAAPHRPAARRDRWPRPITCSATSWCTRFSSTSRRGPELGARRDRRADAAAVVHRGHGRVPVDRSGRPATPPCGCATPRGRDRTRRAGCRRSTTSNKPEYFPYRWGHAFWAYVGGRWGDDVVGEMLRTGAAAGDYDVAIQRRARPDDEGAVGRLARRDSRAHTTRSCARPRRRSEVGRLTICGRQSSAGNERRPGRQPRRALDRVPLGAQPLLDRSLRRRHRNRQDRPQADEHGDRPALLEPAVHPLGRGAGTPRAAASRSRRSVWPAALAIFDAQSGDTAIASATSASTPSTRSSIRPGRRTAAPSRSPG